jgi:hypothetical protein
MPMTKEEKDRIANMIMNEDNNNDVTIINKDGNNEKVGDNILENNTDPVNDSSAPVEEEEVENDESEEEESEDEELATCKKCGEYLDGDGFCPDCDSKDTCPICEEKLDRYGLCPECDYDEKDKE